MSDKITLQDVADKAQVPLSILEKECSKEVLLKLARFCVEWELTGKNLGLTRSEITAIDGDYRSSVAYKRVGMLEKWKGKLAFKATYKKFLEALLADEKSNDEAIAACRIIGEAYPGEMQRARVHPQFQVQKQKWLVTAYTDVTTTTGQLESAKLPEAPSRTESDAAVSDVHGTPAVSDHCTPAGEQLMGRGQLYPSKRLNLEGVHSQSITGSGVVIAILDGAPDINHLSLQRKGIHTENFVEHVQHPISYDQHGTETAAIIGGHTFTTNSNSVQVVVPAGIAPGASLYICQVFHEGKLYGVSQALQHLLTLKRRGTHIDIISMSFGMESSEEVESILSDLAREKVVCIASAGNDGSYQGGAAFPASDVNVLSVGALTPRGKAGCDLNPEHGIDVYAPGEDIVVPLLDPRHDRGRVVDGTSYAAPIVAGFLALLMECIKKKGATPAVTKKFHDINFLRKLFGCHRLCEQRRLIRAHELLNELLKGNINALQLIRECGYKSFDPNASVN